MENPLFLIASIITSSNPRSDESIIYAMVEERLFLLSWIISSLSEEIMPYVVGITRNYLRMFIIVRIIQLQIQFQNLHKDGINMSTFLRRAKILSGKLLAARSPIPTRSFSDTIFTNLSSAYNKVVTTLSFKRQPMAFDKLVEVLSNHEIWLIMQSPVVIANHMEATTSIIDSTKWIGSASDHNFKGSRGHEGATSDNLT